MRAPDFLGDAGRQAVALISVLGRSSASIPAAAIVSREARDPRLPAGRGSVEQAFCLRDRARSEPGGRGAVRSEDNLQTKTLSLESTHRVNGSDSAEGFSR